MNGALSDNRDIEDVEAKIQNAVHTLIALRVRVPSEESSSCAVSDAMNFTRYEFERRDFFLRSSTPTKG